MHQSSVIQNDILSKPNMFTVRFYFVRDGAWRQSRDSSASIWVGAFSDDAVFCPLWERTRAQRVLVPIWTRCILPQRLCRARRRPGWMPGWCQRSGDTGMWQQGDQLLHHWALFLPCAHMWGGFLWKPPLQTNSDLRWGQYFRGCVGCFFGCKHNCKRLPGLYSKAKFFWLEQG